MEQANGRDGEAMDGKVESREVGADRTTPTGAEGGNEDEQKEADDGEGKRSMTKHLEYGNRRCRGTRRIWRRRRRKE